MRWGCNVNFYPTDLQKRHAVEESDMKKTRCRGGSGEETTCQHVQVLLSCLSPSLTLFAMKEETWQAILQFPRQRTPHIRFYFFLALSTFVLVTQLVHIPILHHRVPPHISLAISRCQRFQLRTGPPPEFYERTRSDRYVDGTKPILLKRARIWTGGQNGTEIIHGDILLDMGLIKAVGYVPQHKLNALKDDLVIIDAKNAWVTPGIIDMHSHIGNSAAPELAGASEDYDSVVGNIQVNQIC